MDKNHPGAAPVRADMQKIIERPNLVNRYLLTRLLFRSRIGRVRHFVGQGIRLQETKIRVITLPNQHRTRRNNRKPLATRSVVRKEATR